MEVVEVNRKKPNLVPCHRPVKCPCDIKCTRKYVQPPREKSFAPERGYIPPAQPIEANTTYHLSYLNVGHGDMRRSRSQPIRPRPALDKPDGKFVDETTSKLSYRPIWSVVKAKPILPRRRTMTGSGPMENATTARRDFGQKYVDRPDIIIPCGNIRVSTGQLDDRTTAKLSYMNPGPTGTTETFKPIRTYCPPSQPMLQDTTQKLSFQPFCVHDKEMFPWQLKRIYKPPDTSMCGKTTYTESFLKNEEPRMEKPIIPVAANILPYGAEFAAKTIYKESFLECNTERVEPILPSDSISKGDGKISGDTTSKLSFQAVQVEKRDPFLPRSRNMMGDGPMQSETTNRLEFVPKAASRPEIIIPCSNIRTSESPMVEDTTTKLSYMAPGPIEQVQSFKPLARYVRSAEKVDSETVNKLSYQAWTPGPKLQTPWACKREYQPPTAPMCGDTMYNVSYPLPGHYEEICVPAECECLEETQCPPANKAEAGKDLNGG